VTSGPRAATGPRRRALSGAAALAVAAALAAAGCDKGKPQFRATDVTGAEFGKGFELTDHTGKPRTLADYRGKVVTLFFGYTQCPDVCPTTLAEAAQALKLLGDKASQVQVLFVTVDPERDTQELLSAYVPAFDPGFVGLRGTPEATAKVAKEFRVIYQKVPGSTPATYSIDHTAATFVFDREGRLRLYVRHGQGAEPLAHDLGLLIDGS
jgi:protein SCO1